MASPAPPPSGLEHRRFNSARSFRSAPWPGRWGSHAMLHSACHAPSTGRSRRAIRSGLNRACAWPQSRQRETDHAVDPSDEARPHPVRVGPSGWLGLADGCRRRTAIPVPPRSRHHEESFNGQAPCRPPGGALLAAGCLAHPGRDHPHPGVHPVRLRRSRPGFAQNMQARRRSSTSGPGW